MRTDLGCGKTRQEKVAAIKVAAIPAKDREEQVPRTTYTVSILPNPIKSTGMVVVRDTE